MGGHNINLRSRGIKWDKEKGFAHNHSSITGNSLKGMGFAQKLRGVLPKEKGFAHNHSSITGNSLKGEGFAQNLRWVLPNQPR